MWSWPNTICLLRVCRYLAAACLYVTVLFSEEIFLNHNNVTQCFSKAVYEKNMVVHQVVSFVGVGRLFS